MVNLRTGVVVRTCGAAVLLLALAVVASGQDDLSGRERTFGAQLGERLGDSAAQVERVERPGASGVRVTVPGVTAERLRFESPEQAEAFARSLQQGEAGLVEVRGNQVLVGRGPGLSDPQVADQLRGAGWNVLRAPSSTSSLVRDLGRVRTPSPSAAPSAAPAGRATSLSTSAAAGEEPPAASATGGYGATDMIRHHLLGEELQARQPGAARPRGGRGDADGGGGRDAVAAAATAASPATMGEHQRGRVLAAYDALSPQDQRTFDGLLEHHGDQPAVRDQLLKALAASSPIEDIEWLAGELEGKDPAWIAWNTRLAPANQAGPALRQQFSDSCVPTTAQALRGEYDPVYALRLRQASPQLTSAQDDDALALNPALAREQQTALEAHGGVAAPRDGYGAGVSEESMTQLLNEAGAGAGLQFTPEGDFGTTHPAPERVISVLEEHLAAGRVVPLAITDGGFNGGHAIMATNMRDVGGVRSFLLYDPYYGESRWVTADQLRNHDPLVGDWDHVGLVYVPSGSS